MVSILIPVYNCDVVKLVEDLEYQVLKMFIPFEIICIDDNSSNHYGNHILCKNDNVKWIELNENKGRSIVRNLLAKESKYENLIFMDCDMEVLSDNFIKNYIDLSAIHQVIVGGVTYSKDPPIDIRKNLHWKYGSNRESLSLNERKKNPYVSFMTGNFCIRRSVFEEINFDETIKGYGHEDTLFGIELMKKGVGIYHIDSSLKHLGLENSDVFIDKNKTAIYNLSILIKEGKISENVKVYRYYQILEKYYLLPVLSLAYKILKNKCELNLKSDNPNVRCLDLLKLGLLSDNLSS